MIRGYIDNNELLNSSSTRWSSSYGSSMTLRWRLDGYRKRAVSGGASRRVWRLL